MITWTFIKPANRVGGRKVASVLIVMYFGLFCACTDLEMEVVSEVSATYAEIQRVVVDAAFLDVSYVGDGGIEEVSLDGIIRSNRADFSIFHRQEGNTLYLSVDEKRNRGWGTLRAEGYLRLHGPKIMDVRIASGSGRVTANGITGELISISVSSGSIAIKDCQAETMELLAASGKVTGERLRGRLAMEVASGNLELIDLDGDVSANATSGNIRLTTIGGMVDAYTVSGNIRITGADHLGELKATSGNIRVTSSGLSPNTNLKASSGNINVQTTSLLEQYNFELSSGSGKVRLGDKQVSGTLLVDHGALHTIKGNVTSGNIELFR